MRRRWGKAGLRANCEALEIKWLAWRTLIIAEQSHAGGLRACVKAAMRATNRRAHAPNNVANDLVGGVPQKGTD